jgi:hypothetical protein
MDVWATEPPADPYYDRRLDAWILSRDSAGKSERTVMDQIGKAATKFGAGM